MPFGAGFFRSYLAPMATDQAKPKKAQKAKATPKPTRAERTEAKQEFVRRRIDQRQPDGLIKREFGKEFNCSPRAAERFMTWCREQIRKEVGRTAIEHKGDSYAFWNAIAANQSLPLQLRMDAQKQIDKVIGNHAPVKQANTDSVGRDVDVPSELTSEQARAELIKMLADPAKGGTP